MLSTGNLYAYKPKIITRPIPSSGEPLPIVGLGTWQTFDASPQELAPLKEVLKTFHQMGARVIDSSPMYGKSEQVVGQLSKTLNISQDLFMATKVWTSGATAGKQQMVQSMQRMAKNPMDLMQVHNLVDWKTHLDTLLKWKEQGKVRYVGITHYLESAYSKMESIMTNYPLDFIQINLSLTSRKAQDRLLPLAQERGQAVIINRPYEGGSLFRAVKNQPLPDLAVDIDAKSWGQFFLKYILSNTAVTCAIPGTSKVHHLVDNLSAGMGVLPSKSQRREMERVMDNL